MRWRFLLLMSLVVCNGVFALFFVRAHDDVPLVAPSNIENVTEYLENSIRKHGGVATYQNFLGWASAVPVQEQHTLAHTMGGVLYDMLGKDGLLVCDSSFSYGCYHEFLGRAIHYEGLNVVAALNQACANDLDTDAVACQHGIGHGILTYLGYEESPLRAALKKCDSFPGGDSIMGCYGGVFMEYNLRTMLAVDNIGMREPGDDMRYPCTVLDAGYLPACYFWLPQWWSAMSEDTLEDAYAAIGTWCREAGEDTYIRQCFEGAGNVAVHWSDYVPTEAVKLCEIAADSHREHELYCRAAAAKALFATPATRAETEDVCKGLTEEDRTYCHEYGESAGGFSIADEM